MAGHENDGSGREQNLWAAAGEFTGHGLTWALSVLLFLLGGWWVDGRLGTTPLFMILGAFVGAGAGFYSLWHHVVVEPRRREEARKRREERGAHDREDPGGTGEA